MYKKIKEKISKLFKENNKRENYELFLLKLELKKKRLVKKKDEESKARLKIINKLIEKLKIKLKKIK